MPVGKTRSVSDGLKNTALQRTSFVKINVNLQLCRIGTSYHFRVKISEKYLLFVLKNCAKFEKNLTIHSRDTTLQRRL